MSLSGKYRHQYRHYRLPLRRAGMVLGGLVLTLALLLGTALCISDWSFARSTIESLAAKRLHHEVTVGGPIRASLFSMQPSVHVTDIVVRDSSGPGNRNLGNRNLAEIGQLDFAIDLRELVRGDLVFAMVSVEAPVIALIRESDGRTNFGFDDNHSAVGADSTPNLPTVRRFTLRGGKLYVRDAVHKLIFDGEVEASERANRPEDETFRLRGEGTLNGEPFALRFKGGSLANLKMDEPYAFETNIAAGKTQGKADGAFAKAFDFATISARLNVQGDNLAHLYYLTGLAFPFTPPYRLAGDVRTSRQKIAVHALNGKIGKSDMQGAVTVELAHDRPKLIARLHSQSLNLADLSPAIGKGIRTDAAGDALDSVAPAPLPSDRLFPIYRFEFDRLRVMDADVDLHAESIQTTRMPFQKVSIHLRLDDSVLRLDPVVLTLPQGRLTGVVQIDARGKVARSDLDLRIADVHLDQFKGKNGSEPPLDGVLQARMNIAGTGNSVHDIFATADGQVQAVVPHGEVRKAFAELTGINVARSLGLLLAKDKSRAVVRCGVASVNIHQGNADVTQMIFDTEAILIKGDGHIELNDERLDVDIEGHSKHLRIGRVRAPITVGGTLRKPVVGIDAGDTTKQIGIAAILGTILTPVAAALAFIDPGLAKDENCAGLLAEAQRAQAALKPPVNALTAPAS